MGKGINMKLMVKVPDNPLIRGFTLVELLISVGIVALLSAVAFPSYRKHRDRIDNGSC